MGRSGTWKILRLTPQNDMSAALGHSSYVTPREARVSLASRFDGFVATLFLGFHFGMTGRASHLQTVMKIMAEHHKNAPPPKVLIAGVGLYG